MFEQPPGEHDSRVGAPEPDAAFLKEISTATLAKLLIKKGILSPAEILQQEQELRSGMQDSYESHPRTTRRHGKAGAARRWAAKRRWRRQLTKRLFGWEWKKVRHEKTPG